MGIYIIKNDGTKQVFDKQKVIRTCLRLGVNQQTAEIIADKIEKKIYNGIRTSIILKMIFSYLPKYHRPTKYQYDLRKSLSLLKPKPDFELFTGMLLKEYGYNVNMNQIVAGKCGEHEIDAIAEKNGEIFIVEVKHHYEYHKRTGLDISRNSWAILMDLIEGYNNGITKFKVDKAIVICNTKFSDQAMNYATCRGIDQIGWNYPLDNNIRSLIETKKLYPLTMLKNMKTDLHDKLVSLGIISMKQFISEDIENIAKKTGTKKKILDDLIEQAKSLLQY